MEQMLYYTLASALAGAIASLLVQPLVEVPVALFITRRKVAQDTKRFVAEAEARLLGALKPPEAVAGVLRGGHDPAALNEAKAEKRLVRLRTEADILGELGDRVGAERATWLWGRLTPELRKGAVEAGEKWGMVLEPFLARMPRPGVKEEAVGGGAILLGGAG